MSEIEDLKKWMIENHDMFDERSINKRVDENANFKDLLEKIKSEKEDTDKQ